MAETINDDNKFLNLTQLKVYNTKIKSLISAAQNSADNAGLVATAANTKATNNEHNIASLQSEVDSHDSQLKEITVSTIPALKTSISTAQSTANSAKATAEAAIPKAGGSVSGKLYWQNGSTPNVTISSSGIEATTIVKSGGTASQVLIANGSIKTLGKANGIPTLDSNGFIPINQLGNLDTTVAEVVKALPTTDVKKHIYMVAASSTSSNNIYKEYIYTGDVNAAYDATKWEQLGEFKADVDLSGYLTKTNASNTYLTKTAAGSYLLKTDASNTYLTKTTASSTYAPISSLNNYQFKLDGVVFDEGSTAGHLRITLHDGTGAPAGGGYGIVGDVPNATQALAGLMSKEDKTKLDGIAAQANKITVDSVLSSTSTNPVQNKVINTALAGKASTAVATTTANGLMSSGDKTKLNGIANGANNYVLPRATMKVLGGVQLGSSFIDSEDHLEIRTITNDEISALF